MKQKITWFLCLGLFVTTPHTSGMRRMQNAFQSLKKNQSQESALAYAKRKIQEDPNILFNACKNGDLEQVKLLAVAPEIINSKDERGFTPLFLAVDYEHSEIVKVLIERGAILDAQDNDGYTSLHAACQNGYKEVVQYLVEQGADVNIQSNKNWVPLGPESADYSELERAGEVIRTFTSADGTQVRELLSGGGISPLHLACKHGHKGIINILIKHGARLDACTSFGHTPLHTACQNKHVQTVKLLLLKSFFPILKASITSNTSLQEQCWIKIFHNVDASDKHAFMVSWIAKNLAGSSIFQVFAHHAPLTLQQAVMHCWKQDNSKESANKRKLLREIHCKRYLVHLKNILTKIESEPPISKLEFARQAKPQLKQQIVFIRGRKPRSAKLDKLIDQEYTQYIQQQDMSTPLIVKFAQGLHNNDIITLVTHLINTATFDALNKDVRRSITNNIAHRLTLHKPSSCNNHPSWSNRND